MRNEAGRPVLHLTEQEVQLLVMLLEDLAALLDGGGDDDPVLRRLHPAAYRDDPAAEDEYRGLTESGLRERRDERVTAIRAQLSGAAGGAQIELSDPDTARQWLQVLNDVRLALGTRLGVTQDDDRDIDPDDPDAQPWIVYSWLTAVQDTVVQTQLPD